MNSLPPLPAEAEQAKDRGNRHFKDKEFAQAEAEYSGALEISPVHPVLLSNRSAARHGLGNFTAALEDADAALRVNPGWEKVPHCLLELLERGCTCCFEQKHIVN